MTGVSNFDGMLAVPIFRRPGFEMAALSLGLKFKVLVEIIGPLVL